MAVVDLYNGIYKVLANDPDVLNYLGVGASADNLVKARRIQKRNKPTNLVEDNMPLVTFYTPNGGRNPDNHYVYVCPFVFDIYTSDDVDTAQRLANRIIKLFDGELHPMQDIESFESYFVQGFETDVDATNTYCFTVVIEFSVTLEE